MGKHLIIPLESRDTDRKSCVELIGGSTADQLQPIAEGGTNDRPKPCYRHRNWALHLQPFSYSKSTVVPCALVCLFAMTLLGLAHGVPTPSLGYSESFGIDSTDDVGFDEDFFENEDSVRRTADQLDDEELNKIRRSIMEGLGIDRIPDPSKANVSQAEYERAHREYLKRLQLSHGEEERRQRRLHTFHARDHPGNRSRRSIASDEDRHLHTLYFPVDVSLENVAVDHASLRLLLGAEDNDDGDKDHLDVLVYQTIGSSRRLILRQRLLHVRSQESRWVELDSTEAAASWLEDGLENLGLELLFRQNGVPVRRSVTSPALNVFTTLNHGRRLRRAAADQLMSLHKGRRTECRGDNKKCCRHEMTVIFKDLKGFEFIIQPKTFDAGYCKGRCPPRYNPAHHHALLQSLIWKEDKRKAPRPCCAPSKLAELEILYFDENDSTKLKVSNWKNMRVLECACS